MSHLGGAAVSSITLGPKQLGAVRRRFGSYCPPLPSVRGDHAQTIGGAQAKQTLTSW